MGKQLIYIIFVTIISRPLISMCSSYISFAMQLHMIILLLSLLMFIFFVKSLDNFPLLFFIIFILVLGINTFINIDSLNNNINDAAKILCIILIFILFKAEDFFSALKDLLYKYYNIVSFIIYGIGGFILFELLTRRNFEFRWGDYYYKSIFDGQHTFAFFLIFMIAFSFLMFKIRKNKLFLGISGIFFVALVSTGARAALLVSIILIFLLIKNTFKITAKTILLAAAIFSVLFIIAYFTVEINDIPIIKKTINQEMFSDISSGRFTIWYYDIEYYKKESLADKIIGNGFRFPYIYHSNSLGMNIWSHNDFINILLSMGALGLLVYLFFIAESIITVKTVSNISNALLFGLFYFCCAFLNGFYNYGDLICTLVIIRMILPVKNQEQVSIQKINDLRSIEEY